MSDKLRMTLGIILLIVSILLCAVPIIESYGKTNSVTVKSGTSAEWLLRRIEPEMNGAIRVNYADEEELTRLPGIGETLSGLIVSERDRNGPYYYPEDLEAVRGIGPQTLAGFRNLIDMTLEEGGN